MSFKIKNLNGLFLEQLRDRYNAAKQQTAGYQTLKEAATNEELVALITKDINSNDSHIDNLRDIFNSLDEVPEGEHCEGTQGLIHEANEILSYIESGNVLDIGIAMSIQHINHHDIAGYRSCQLYASALGKEQHAKKLATMLQDEKDTDKALEDVIVKLLKL